MPRSDRNARSLTREASANNTQTRVTSAIVRTASCSTSRWSTSKTSVNNRPAVTKTIGADRRADWARAETMLHPTMVASTRVTDVKSTSQSRGFVVMPSG